MYTLGVIMARAGSVGLQNKHLLPLLGVPVIQYTFDAVRRSRLLNLTVVSSDCPNVLALAEANGFPALKRPAELATSDATVQDVLLHAMDHVEADYDVQVTAVATLYGNVPIRAEGIIDSAIELLARTRCDSVRSFCPVGKWHPQWMSTIQGDRAIAHRPGSVHRRQDLESLFLHDGAIVVSSRAAMEAGRMHREDPHAFFGVDRRAVVSGHRESVEVDTQRDLLYAECILRESNMKSAEARVA